MDVDKLLVDKRHVSTGFHFSAGQAWRRKGAAALEHSALVYSALEFRCAIERFVIELLVLIAPWVAQTPEKLRDFGSVVAMAHQDAGNKHQLWRIFTFNEAYARMVMGIPVTVAVPDIGVLHSWWQKLSDYCHRQLDLENTWDSPQWVAEGYARLEEIERILYASTVEQRSGWLKVETMPIEMREERERFLAGSYSKSSLERRLRLIIPVVQARLTRTRAGA